jgi:hypothetical protein
LSVLISVLLDGKNEDAVRPHQEKTLQAIGLIAGVLKLPLV